MAELKKRGVQYRTYCANSAAFVKYPAFYHNLVRLGISLYGVCPVTKGKIPELKPVLSWKSRIIFLKQVPAGTPVSYACTYRTRRRSRIATAAFGYADGYRRSFSNKGMVLVRGQKVPVLGRVTMDMTMLDVTDLPEVHVGDEVTILGKQGAAEVPVHDLAQWAGTSPYEIFCGIAARVPRVAVRSAIGYDCEQVDWGCGTGSLLGWGAVSRVWDKPEVQARQFSDFHLSLKWGTRL